MKKILLALALLLTAVHAEERRALLIGNGAYAHNPLKNPRNDVHDLAKLLKSLGFKVTLLENADLKTMKTAVKRFAQQLNNDSVGLFFFSGHGIQHEGKNYLLPIGAPIESSAELEYEALAGDFVADAMHESGSPTNLIFFDACRNNPLPFAANRGGQRGLALMARGSGTLIAFATGPGHWAADGDGRNSPYTAALLRHLREPVVLEEMLRNVARDMVQATGGQQQPWHHLSLLEAFYFNRSGNTGTTAWYERVMALLLVGFILYAPYRLYGRIRTRVVERRELARALENLSPENPESQQTVLLAAHKSYQKKDFRRALKLYHQLAAVNNSEAMKKIAGHYSAGRGDYAAAQKWYEKALAAGDSASYALMGALYETGGGGIKKDLATAKSYYEKAILAGDKMGYRGMGFVYKQGDSHITRDWAVAKDWFEKAIAAGDWDSYGHIGQLYDYGGPGLNKNWAQAKAYYEKQAAAGDRGGYYSIGLLYMWGGPGLKQDFGQACAYYRKSGTAEKDPIQRACRDGGLVS